MLVIKTYPRVEGYSTQEIILADRYLQNEENEKNEVLPISEKRFCALKKYRTQITSKDKKGITFRFSGIAGMQPGEVYENAVKSVLMNGVPDKEEHVLDKELLLKMYAASGKDIFAVYASKLPFEDKICTIKIE